jgi:hypothetical protein
VNSAEVVEDGKFRTTIVDDVPSSETRGFRSFLVDMIPDAEISLSVIGENFYFSPPTYMTV